MLFEAIEETRIKVSKFTDAKHKSELGQFFTPLTIAKFMASLFPNKRSEECVLLDAGAGIGSLSDAFLERCVTKELEFKKIKIEAYEIDNILRPFLEKTLNKYVQDLNFDYEIKSEDFIEAAVNSIQFNSLSTYTHAILNPPYLKINCLSNYRLLLNVGIETVNLYSAFVALSVLLMRDGGQIVTIIPRSFCNGPYYKTFRKLILSKCAIRQIHLFESRNSAFKDDQVLQENVILYLEVDGIQADVKVSVSTDDKFYDYSYVFYPFEAIVKGDDSELFIHVPSSKNKENEQNIFFAQNKLSEIGLFISTGPIVDFRLKNHLRDNPDKNTSPLIYPAHFTNGQVEWPKSNIKKPNAIMRNSETEKWFFQNGFYCIVRRFSSKEEKKRIVACLVDPSNFQGEEYIGFENHLNVYHIEKHGMPEALAKGLVLYLNTSIVDKYFRQFSGHTQVNAADLKLIKYPSRDVLIELGKYYNKVANDQYLIDEIVKEVCER